MLVFCPQCDADGLDRRIDADNSVAICPNCEHSLSIRYLPLFLVGGASGVGKSTVCRELAGEIAEIVCLDVDVLWDGTFSAIEDSFAYNAYYLRQGVTVAQSGRPVVLFGAEVGQPGVVRETSERRYFSSVHYLALVCEPEVQSARLRERANWPDVSDRWTVVDEQIALNRWYEARGRDSASPIETLDVTDLTVEQTTERVVTWITERLEAE